MDDCHKPELLAPAGGYEQLVAAVENGADAVYMGGTMHNARRSATNFDDATLAKALDYAHIRGVSAYITFNTLISQQEMPDAIKYALRLYSMGADALIVQDLGFAAQIRDICPDFPLHLSTQGTACDIKHINKVASLGIERVVLARELELPDIARIAQSSPVPVECFVHGAMCVAYSGQCLFSSMIGARSGNRGACAQPCRLAYTLHKNGQPQAGGYLLSPKDLCGLHSLQELVKTGVASLKIEGRMKSPAYVATVTGIYRDYLDNPREVDPQDEKALLQAFNRGGFSNGYFGGWSGHDHVCRERPKHWGVPVGNVTSVDAHKKTVEVLLSDTLALGDGVECDCEGFPGNIVTALYKDGNPQSQGEAGDLVRIGRLSGVQLPAVLYKTSSKAAEQKALLSFASIRRKVPLRAQMTLKIGEKATLTLRDDARGHTVTTNTDLPVEPARKRALTREDVEKQLHKTGNTPFDIAECIIHLDEGAALSVSQINQLRREALECMANARSNRYPQRVAPEYFDTPGEDEWGKNCSAALNAYFFDLRPEQIAAAHAAQRITLPFSRLIGSASLEYLPDGPQRAFWLPAETTPNLLEQISNHATRLKDNGFTHAYIGSLGQLEWVQSLGFAAWGDTGLNVFNPPTLNLLAKWNCAGATLSPEMSLSQIKALPAVPIATECAVYGRQPLMLSKHCVIGAETGGGASCGLCKTGHYSLEDRTGAHFPLQCYAGSCRMLILNSVKLHVPELAQPLQNNGVSWLRLHLCEEAPEDTAAQIAQYQGALLQQPGRVPKGQLYTAGHYMRGV